MLGGIDVDLLFTGALGHHEALAAIEQGKCVVTAFHSNTERTFLRERMKGLLEKEIRAGLRSSDMDLPEALVEVSGIDRDPYEVFTFDQVGA